MLPRFNIFAPPVSNSDDGAAVPASFTVPVIAALLFISSGCENGLELEQFAGSRSLDAGISHSWSSDLTVQGGVIHLEILHDQMPVADESVVNWVQAAAGAVSAYFGRFPVRDIRIVISA